MNESTRSPAIRKARPRNVEMAVWAAERGWTVVKVNKRTKRPIEEWQDLGYRDPETVRRIWRNEPVGILTGPSGFVYDDLDVDEEGNPAGEWSLESILPDGNWGKLPATFELHSPSGGRGLLWKAPRGREYKTCSGQVAPHFDVRGRGGMFVLYDASTPGRFIVDGRDPVVMPWWLSELHPEPGSSPNGRGRKAADVPDARAWLVKYGVGEPCEAMAETRDKWLAAMKSGVPHEVMIQGVTALVGDCAAGHTGLNDALWDFRDAYYAAMRGKSRERDKVSEWRSAIVGAIRMKVPARGVYDTDPCVELEAFYE